MFKRNGLYYMIYAANDTNGCVTSSSFACQRYATATNPMGPWTHRGVVLGQVSSTTNHAGVVQFNGQWYMVYHNANAPGGGNFRRSVAVDLAALQRRRHHAAGHADDHRAAAQPRWRDGAGHQHRADARPGPRRYVSAWENLSAINNGGTPASSADRVEPRLRQLARAGHAVDRVHLAGRAVDQHGSPSTGSTTTRASTCPRRAGAVLERHRLRRRARPVGVRVARRTPSTPSLSPRCQHDPAAAGHHRADRLLDGSPGMASFRGLTAVTTAAVLVAATLAVPVSGGADHRLSRRSPGRRSRPPPVGYTTGNTMQSIYDAESVRHRLLDGPAARPSAATTRPATLADDPRPGPVHEAPTTPA